MIDFLKNYLVPFKHLSKDIVDLWMIILFFVVAVMDFFVNLPSGGYALFLVYTLFALRRMNYWKYKN